MTQLLSGQGQQPGTGQPVPVAGVPACRTVGEAIDDAAEGTTDPVPRRAESPTPPPTHAAAVSAAAVSEVRRCLPVLPVLPVAALWPRPPRPLATADDLTTAPVTASSDDR